MTEKLNVAIIGGGQAGLSVSYFLKQAGVDHTVLEAGQVGETWRSRRWGSFPFVAPNWSMKLPGGEDTGAGPAGSMPVRGTGGHFEGSAKSSVAPLRTAVD